MWWLFTSTQYAYYKWRQRTYTACQYQQLIENILLGEKDNNGNAYQ